MQRCLSIQIAYLHIHKNDNHVGLGLKLENETPNQ